MKRAEKLMIAKSPPDAEGYCQTVILATEGKRLRKLALALQWWGHRVGAELSPSPEFSGLWVYEGSYSTKAKGWSGSWRWPTPLEAENIAIGLDPFLSK